MRDGSASLRECEDCGLWQTLPEAGPGALVACERCGKNLRQIHDRSLLPCAACGALGLLLFALALLLPVASVSLQGGRFATSDLFGSVAELDRQGAWELSLAVAVTLLILPALRLLAVLGMVLSIELGRTPRFLRRLFAALPRLRLWAMVEVFLLGALVALFRLRVWMQVHFGGALWALMGVGVCALTVDAALDTAAVWRRVPLAPPDPRDAPPSANTDPRTRLACTDCALVSEAAPGERCARCAGRLHARKPRSVRRTWSWIAAAALLLIPANVLPVLTITKLGQGGPSTILGGTLELLRRGLWGLALLVFVASIVVPATKLVALGTLLVSTRLGSRRALLLRTRVFRAVARIGRFSMLDIFATATLVALARFGWLGNVQPEPGAIAFCAVVILTMLASESFDPRLMWDAARANSDAPGLGWLAERPEEPA